MFADKGFVVFRGLFEQGNVGFISSIADCHGEVAQNSATLGAFEGAAFEALIKLNG